MDASNVLTLSLKPPSELAEEDRALVAAARKDPNAAGQLFDKHYPEIFRYIYHSTHDRTVTEDLTSNVFFSAFRRLGLFRWRRVPFRAWLYRIATNELRMHYRRQKRRHTAHAGQVDADYPSAAPDAGVELAALDDWRRLHGALLDLGEKYRTVIVLRYFEDKSLSEISEITNKREGTIKSLLHRGILQLRESLARAGVALR
jgi:RNA polymerase sigma-70 factor (ECF subfamily)